MGASLPFDKGGMCHTLVKKLILLKLQTQLNATSMAERIYLKVVLAPMPT